ncbi:MAG: hypothetical protein ATN35_12935 [Epulopiscium sp. Nele67-Bin004]|nr:MAG: hypothetical protein ATN35_12935 [Epulopiscium sp. Nele67-Bin004]
MVATFIYFVSFFIHDLIFFNLVQKFMPTRGNGSTVYLLANINAIIFTFLVAVFNNSVLTVYSVMTIIYIIDTMLAFKGRLTSRLVCALICPIHLFAFSIIISPFISIAFGSTLIYHTRNTAVVVIRRIVSAVLSAFCVYILSKLTDEKYIDAFDNPTNHSKSFLALEILLIFFLLSAAQVNQVSAYYSSIFVTQFLLGFGSIFLFYIGLFSIVASGIIKERENITQDKFIQGMYKHLILENSDRLIEVDCTTGLVLNYVVEGTIKSQFIGTPYPPFINGFIDNQMHESDREHVRQLSSIEHMNKIALQADNRYTVEYRLKDLEKDYQWFRASVIAEPSHDHIRSIITINNIEHEKELLVKANKDALSGLYNKHTTEELIRDHLRHHNSGVLFMIDVDNFKGINDNFGHDFGDDVIREVADKISGIFNLPDIVGRIGGDEFMVFVKSQDYINIGNKANCICSTIRQTYIQNGIDITISASVGISEFTSTIDTFEKLYSTADKAMYLSKNNGKNNYTIYTPDIS